MALSGPQKKELRQAILDHFNEPALRLCLSDKFTKDLDHVTTPRGTLPERVDELLQVAAREDWLDDLARALKQCNPARALQVAIDAVLGAAAKEGPERWAAWLEEKEAPEIRTVNPYQLLRMKRGEVGDAYDFDDLEKLPPYVPRTVDADLDEILEARLKAGGLVLIVAKFGKSRTAFEALWRNCPERRILVPRFADPASAGHLIRDFDRLAADLKLAVGAAVLWLDDLHDRLSALTALPDLAGTIRRVTEQHRLLIMATMWDTEYGRIRQATIAGPAPAAGELHRAESESLDRQSGEVLWLAERTKVFLEAGSFLESDVERSYPRPQHPALWSCLDGGEDLASAMIAWPILLETFKTAPPEMKAVVHAAIDLRRAGVVIPLPQTALEQLFGAYYTQAGGVFLTPVALRNRFFEALQAATGAIGKQRLLAPIYGAGAEPDYEPYSRLVHHVDTPADGAHGPRPPKIPACTWKAALALAADKRGVGLAAYKHGETGVAERAFRAAIESGDGKAAHNLGLLLAEQGKSEEAEQAFSTGMKLGDDWAAYNLGVLLAEMGKTTEAKRAYRTGMKLGVGSAANNLGVLLKEQGKSEEAVRAYHTGMELGHGGAAFNLGVLLEEQGKSAEAEAAYRKGVALGSGEAAFNLGVQLALKNQLEDSAASFAQALQMLGTGLQDERFADGLRALRASIGPEAYGSLMANIAAKQGDVP